MREIKYRAWNILCKEYIYNIEQENDGCIGPCDCFGDYLHNDNYVVEQYTGLKDKRNTEKDLYENDLVKVDGHYSGDNKVDGFVGRIEWSDDCWLVVDVAYKDNAVSLWDYVYNYCGGLIGNIHEATNG